MQPLSEQEPVYTSEHVTMLPLWEWVPATETTLRAGFRKFPHSYFRVGTPTFFVSRVASHFHEIHNICNFTAHTQNVMHGNANCLECITFPCNSKHPVILQF